MGLPVVGRGSRRELLVDGRRRPCQPAGRRGRDQVIQLGPECIAIHEPAVEIPQDGKWDVLGGSGIYPRFQNSLELAKLGA